MRGPEGETPVTCCSPTARASTATRAARRATRWARSCSRRACRATRSRSPTRRSTPSCSRSPPRWSATTGSARRRWSPTASTRAGRSCARPSTRITPRAPRAAGSTGCATAVCRPSRASTPGRSCATSARPARCRAGSSRPRRASPRRRELIAAEPPMTGRDLARAVTPERPQVHAGDGSGPRIVALDTGIKASIVRNFVTRGATLELLPCTTPADEVLERGADGIFLVPGPGDPAALGYLVETVRALVGRTPVFGICLGHQLLSRAVGLDTFKLPFGHRGGNHPGEGPAHGADRDHGAEPRLRGAGRAGPAPGHGLRRGRAHPRQPLRRHDRGDPAARRAGGLRPVPPRGGARPARLARPVRRVHRRDRGRACRGATTCTRSSCSARARS